MISLRPSLSTILGLLCAVAVPLVLVTAARADGEAGLVVQHGDGSTETFCVTFTGDSIRGDDLLRHAGVPVEQFSGLVCSLGARPDESCPGASSFDSCTCKCQGPSCVYWAFFTQRHGQGWVYSALGLAAQQAKNGDLQAWKWGKGGPSSAPAPAPITFEQVCGHAPRGGAAIPPPTQQPPTPVAATGGSAPEATAVGPPSNSSAPTPGALAGDQGTASASPNEGSFTPVPAETAAPVSAVESAGSSPGEAAPIAKPAAPGRGDGVPAGVAAFAVIAAVLVAAIAVAAYRGRRHGSR